MDVKHVSSGHKGFSLQQKHKEKFFKATTSCYPNDGIHIIMYIVNIVDVMHVILFVI